MNSVRACLLILGGLPWVGCGPGTALPNSGDDLSVIVPADSSMAGYDLSAAADLGQPPPDLASNTDLPVHLDMTAPVDQSVAIDLNAAPRDLTGVIQDFAAPPFCKGTKVEDTCAATFFGRAWQCWSPAGACGFHLSQGSSSSNYFCWTSGATLQSYANGGYANWRVAGGSCLSGRLYDPQDPMATIQFTAPGGDLLSYDIGSGDVVCPDGSKINVGPNFGGCTDLRALLSQPDANSCPPDPNGKILCN